MLFTLPGPGPDRYQAIPDAARCRPPRRHHQRNPAGAAIRRQAASPGQPVTAPAAHGPAPERRQALPDRPPFRTAS
jgi:hypothetical protein